MNTVPLFPEFRKFIFEDVTWYDEFYRSFPNYADFTFNNLIIWQDQHDDLSVSRIDNILVFRCTSLYMDNQLMINFIGVGDYDNALRMIFHYLESQSQEQVVLGVPEFIVAQLTNPESFAIVEDRDNAEYVIDTHLLSTLEGSEMKRMRQLVNGYERDNVPITIEEFDLSDDANREFLQSELLSWQNAFSTNETAGQEKDVIIRTLSLAGDLDYGNVSLFVDGHLAGFALYRAIPSASNDTVVVNHLKTSYGYMHTSYYLTHMLARTLSEKGYKYMNYEQDLGVEGLRIFKERLKPAALLNKFNISPK